MWVIHTGSGKASFSDGSLQLQFMMDIMRLTEEQAGAPRLCHRAGDESDRREMKRGELKQSCNPQ